MPQPRSIPDRLAQDVVARVIALSESGRAPKVQPAIFALAACAGLGDELTARTVRVRDGVPAVTDGPYVEAKEFVSSFFLLDVDGEKRALEIAAEYPFAAHAAVEVWPILHESGEPG